MNQSIELPTLETARLSISALKPEDADELFEPFSDPELYRFISCEAPESRESLRAKFEKICMGKSPDGKQTWLNWNAKNKSSGKCSGFYEVTIEGAVAFLAYYTFKPFQGLGYAKEGISEIIKFIRSHFELEKLILEIDTRNRASVNLAESLGFQWVETVNNACNLKGFQSHEFRFEKPLIYPSRPISKADTRGYIQFRYPLISKVEKEKKSSHLLTNFQRYISDQEKIFICLYNNKIVGSACLLQFQPGSFGIGNLVIRSEEEYKDIFKTLLLRLVDEAKKLNGTKLEYRLVEGPMKEEELSQLENANFQRKYHRTEFKKNVADLPGDEGTPLNWSPLVDLSEESLKSFAKLMARAAQGDPDFHPDDDAFECINGYLSENELNHGEECFQVGKYYGKDVAIIIAQVNPKSGWSRITYMGLLPEFRRKGLGKWLHRHGFQMIKEQEGTQYHGGTLSCNKPMMRLFERHGCEKLRTMQGWVLPIP